MKLQNFILSEFYYKIDDFLFESYKFVAETIYLLLGFSKIKYIFYFEDIIYDSLIQVIDELYYKLDNFIKNSYNKKIQLII